MTVSHEAERRSRLLAIKLAALVRDHLGTDSDADARPGVFGRGAALVRAGRAWVLVDQSPMSGLGPAIAWARQQGVDSVSVLAERDTGVLARRAKYFNGSIDVWHVDERTLLPAIHAPFEPTPHLPESHHAFRDTILAGGAEPLVEHGVLVGEVAGLEVCRVVHDEHLGVDRLEVGAGAHDREAFQIMHGDRPTAAALASVVATVAAHRSPGADPHPLNRLGAERLLRARLIADPDAIGCAELSPAEPPQQRTNLKDPVPCVAVGHRDNGDRVVVVCSSGVDLDLLPFAADARAFHAAEGGLMPELIVVVPARDRLPVVDAIAARLRIGATVVTAP